MSERDTQIARLYFEDGLTMREIGEQFGISRQRVDQVLRGVKGKRHGGMAKRQARLLALQAIHTRITGGSSTLAEEAAALGRDPESLRGSLWQAGFRFPRTPARHGTMYRYKRGCRCEECRRANRDQQRRRRVRGPMVHGTDSSYSNFGCRCQECREARRLANRERKAIQRQTKEGVD